MPLLQLEGVTQRFGGLVAVDRARFFDRGGLDRGDDRTERRRQIDGVQPDHRASTRRAPAASPSTARRSPAQDERDRGRRHRAHVPEHPALRVHVGARQRDDRRTSRACARACSTRCCTRRAQRAEERRVRERALELLRFVDLDAQSPSSTRATSPTACSAGSRSRGRWRAIRSCCCSTNPRPA